MSLNNPRPHHGHAAEYQQSSIPWCKTTSGAQANVKVAFPFVTRWISIYASHACTVAFSATGAGNTRHFLIPAGGTTVRLELKVTDIWVTVAAGNLSILAGLTNVKAGDFPSIVALDGIA
jgi:hypothetical protein